MGSTLLFTLTAVLTLFALQVPARAEQAPILKPTHLRCEYHVNPLGIDIVQPRLSWLLESDKSEVRDQSQSAYQILVASSKEKLNESSADLWNTGKILSDVINQIVYTGEALTTGEQCFWTVRTWNASGQASNWS